MTKELLQEQLEILDRTNMHKNAAKERVIPESYLAYKNQVEQKETMLESPSTGVPVRCVITKANTLEKDAPLFINLHGGGFVHPQLQPGGVSLLPDALPGRRDGLQRPVLGHLDGGTRQGAELRPCGEQGRVRELPCREPRLYKNL